MDRISWILKSKFLILNQLLSRYCLRDTDKNAVFLMASKVDREITCEKLIMIVVSLILEIKKRKLLFKSSFLKNIKTANRKVKFKDAMTIKNILFTGHALLILDVGETVNNQNVEIKFNKDHFNFRWLNVSLLRTGLYLDNVIFSTFQNETHLRYLILYSASDRLVTSSCQ